MPLISARVNIFSAMLHLDGISYHQAIPKFWHWD
jgi:hypothetical protein